jgi:hypothetical protein
MVAVFCQVDFPYGRLLVIGFELLRQARLEVRV